MRRRRWLRGERAPLLGTAAILLILYAAAAALYPAFLGWRVALGMLSDYSFLGIAGVGMSLVIYSGGIDLSVGAVAGFTSIFTAVLIGRHGFSPAAAWAVALAVGAAFGAALGGIISGTGLPPFLVTLAGMFLARGTGYWISTDSVGIPDPLYSRLANFDAFGIGLRFPALALLAAVALGWVVAHHTRFGRGLFAMGGSEDSALLMGVPVRPFQAAAYAVSGFCAALGGLVATVYTGSGNPNLGGGLELDAIAIVVIGGALLTGGRGHMLGTLLGLLIYSTIAEAILFDGRLDPWWSRIVVGILLLAFILLQRLLAFGAARRPPPISGRFFPNGL